MFRKRYVLEQQVDGRGYSAPGGSATQAQTQANQIASQAFGQPGTSRTTTNTPMTEVLSQQNMSPQSLASLEALITMLQGGGSLQQRAEVAKKKQTQEMIQNLLGQFSTSAAFSDAQGLMALNLQKALESNRPAIQRSVEGAGTSASSMQGLLSQNMARDAALAASALGADQAKSYGGISANLSGTLGQMASQVMDPATEALIAALGVSKGAIINSTKTTTGGNRTESNSGSPMAFGSSGSSSSMFQEPRFSYAGADAYANDPITQLSNAISGKSPNTNAFSQIGPTNQMADLVASYKRAPGVYSDTPI